MKILKIFGLVVGIHLAALILIFANPGCSSSTKPPPTPGDTVVKAEPPPAAVTAPASAAPAAAPLVVAAPRAEPASAAPVLFDPNAVAASPAGTAPGTVRFLPTRPNTPVAGALVAEPVKDVTPTTTYVVKSGDSLWTIAKKNKVTVADLTAANGIAANANLQPGQKLLIPAKSGSAPSPAAAPVSGNGAAGAAKAGKSAKSEPAAAPRSGGATTSHLVRSGESLTTIARDYGVRQRDIAVANNITDPAKIRAGDKLVIPLPAGKSAPAAKSPAGETPVIPLQPAAAPAVPVIRLDEPPVVPAPKS